MPEKKFVDEPETVEKENGEVESVVELAEMVKDEFGEIEKSKSEEVEVENKSGVKCVNESGIAVEVVNVPEDMIVDGFGTVKEKYVVKTDESEINVGRYAKGRFETGLESRLREKSRSL